MQISLGEKGGFSKEIVVWRRAGTAFALEDQRGRIQGVLDDRGEVTQRKGVAVAEVEAADAGGNIWVFLQKTPAMRSAEQV